MFMLAILTYVISEDLSLRPHLQELGERNEGRSQTAPSRA